MFIMFQLWNTFHQEQAVVPSLKQSLKDLRVDYVDLYLIHWPQAYKVRLPLKFPHTQRTYVCLISK